MFSFIVFYLGLFLSYHLFPVFFIAMAFISIFQLISFCNDIFYPGEFNEFRTICKCQLVFHTDIIHFLFYLFLANQSFSGSGGSLLVVLQSVLLASLAVAVDPSNLVRIVQTVR